MLLDEREAQPYVQALKALGWKKHGYFLRLRTSWLRSVRLEGWLFGYKNRYCVVRLIWYPQESGCMEILLDDLPDDLEIRALVIACAVTMFVKNPKERKKAR